MIKSGDMVFNGVNRVYNDKIGSKVLKVVNRVQNDKIRSNGFESSE